MIFNLIKKKGLANGESFSVKFYFLGGLYFIIIV